MRLVKPFNLYENRLIFFAVFLHPKEFRLITGKPYFCIYSIHLINPFIRPIKIPLLFDKRLNEYCFKVGK